MHSANTKMGDTKISRVIVRSNEAVSNDGRTCSQPVGWGRSIRSYHETRVISPQGATRICDTYRDDTECAVVI